MPRRSEARRRIGFRGPCSCVRFRIGGAPSSRPASARRPVRTASRPGRRDASARPSDRDSWWSPACRVRRARARGACTPPHTCRSQSPAPAPEEVPDTGAVSRGTTARRSASPGSALAGPRTSLPRRRRVVLSARAPPAPSPRSGPETHAKRGPDGAGVTETSRPDRLRARRTPVAASTAPSRRRSTRLVWSALR